MTVNSYKVGDHSTTNGNADANNAGQLRFQVDAGLLFQLGEQLVARRSVALAELIKNGYDADATQVTVTFKNVTKPKGTIIVEDKGSGMTFEDIERAWMRIAYSDKRQRLISARYCRPLTGAKGIGRFACRRLSHKLKLSTVAKRPDGSKERVIVHFNWADFESGTELTEVPILYERSAVSQNTPTGVTLSLDEARDIWTPEDATELQRDLLSLTSPFTEDEEAIRPTQPSKGCKPDPGFVIEFKSMEFPKQSGRLDETFLGSAWKLTGRVDEQGLPHYCLNIRGIEQPVSFDPDLPKEDHFPDLVGVRFLIYFMVYKADFLAKSGFGVRDASEFGRKNAGVRVYLNNFRVFPYGEPGDDWLGLDQLRASRNTALPALLEPTAGGVQRPLLLIPGNNQLYGAVYIMQNENPKLELPINRERLIENEAFEQLVRFVRTGVFWLTIQYARSLAETEARQSSPENKVVSSIERLEQVIAHADDINPEDKAKLGALVAQIKQAAQEREQVQMSELSLLRVLASAGTMIIMFMHQLRGVIDGLERISYDLKTLRNRIPATLHTEYDPLLEQLDDWRQTVENQAEQIGVLVGYDSRNKQRRIAVREVVDRVIRSLRGYIKRCSIEVYNSIPPYVRTPPMFEAEFHAIILNVLTNALKAVRGQPTRKIQLDALQDKRGLIIQVSDTGIGLDVGSREEVFRPLVTTSAPDPILGVGTGIGLKVVRDLMHTYQGYAQFIDAQPPWATTIELFLPKGV